MRKDMRKLLLWAAAPLFLAAVLLAAIAWAYYAPALFTDPSAIAAFSRHGEHVLVLLSLFTGVIAFTTYRLAKPFDEEYCDGDFGLTWGAIGALASVGVYLLVFVGPALHIVTTDGSNMWFSDEKNSTLTDPAPRGTFFISTLQAEGISWNTYGVERQIVEYAKPYDQANNASITVRLQYPQDQVQAEQYYAFRRTHDLECAPVEVCARVMLRKWLDESKVSQQLVLNVRNGGYYAPAISALWNAMSAELGQTYAAMGIALRDVSVLSVP